MLNTFSRSKKESLKDQIDKLDTIEHRQIYNIIKGYQPQTTKVQNGVLVSTDTLNDACLQEIEKYVSFCLDQRKRIEQDSKARRTYERMNV